MSFFRASGGNKFKIVNGSAKVRVAESKVLYFNGAVDSDWNTLGNWWLDESFTISAMHLPRSIDSVVMWGSVYSNSGSSPTVEDITFQFDYNEIQGVTNGISIIVIGLATFNGYFSGNGSRNQGNIIGDATFNHDSHNYATVNGDATFNDSSVNFGTVSGDATFNDTSYNGYTVSGDATFNDSSGNGSTVSGDATFNDSSYNDLDGIVNGDATFNDSSYNSIGSTITGNATFNNSSYNDGTMTGDATFNDSSVNNGNTTQSDLVAYFNNNSINNGSVAGYAIFSGGACNSINGTFEYSQPDPPPSCS